MSSLCQRSVVNVALPNRAMPKRMWAESAELHRTSIHVILVCVAMQSQVLGLGRACTERACTRGKRAHFRAPRSVSPTAPPNKSSPSLCSVCGAPWRCGGAHSSRARANAGTHASGVGAAAICPSAVRASSYTTKHVPLAGTLRASAGPNPR